MKDHQDSDNIFIQAQNQLALTISKVLSSIEDREDRIEALRRLKNAPSSQTLTDIHEMALEKEEYETCEAIKSYATEKGIIIQ